MSDTRELACVLVPVHERLLLLPNVTVAEVVRMQRVQPVSNAPPWLVGMTSWRGKVIPVLSPEAVLTDADAPEPPSPGCSLLVMNRSRPVDGLEFYVLLVRAMPRMLWVAAEDLSVLDGVLGAGEAARLKLGQDAVSVPHLPFFEDLVMQHKLTPGQRRH
ncbi:MAG: chemotaxis protein CheW [Pseudomonadales bacterium]|nr:chemotaxis protein CheW [Pseudomonadales bacterium]MEE2892311.1 chemotaxis protein CheW [Pseudomonadota bacterium]